MTQPATPSAPHDVFAYGMIAPSTLLELADDYPPPAGYAEIAAIHPSIGGEAAGSAYALARLGIRTKLAGTRLGRDAESARVIDVLTEAGVDCGAITLEGDHAPATEVVVAAGDERTIFGTYRQFAVDRAWHGADETDVTTSRIVCLDPFLGEASLQVMEWCLSSGIPYVTIDVAPDSELARNAGVLIVSEEFATRTIATDPHQVVAAFTAQGRGLVMLTHGGGRILSAENGEDPQDHHSFAVSVRDTTGAGDSFRAGVVYGMLRGFDTVRMIRTASAVAALVCERAPGVLGSPTEPELEAFLALRP